MENRSLKDLLHEQVARIGKAVSSPKRLELLELLAQGEKTVETLAAELAADIKLTSALSGRLGPVALDRTRVAHGTGFFLDGGAHERGSDRYLEKEAYPTTAIRLNWGLTSLEKA